MLRGLDDRMLDAVRNPDGYRTALCKLAARILIGAATWATCHGQPLRRELNDAVDEAFEVVAREVQLEPVASREHQAWVARVARKGLDPELLATRG